MLVEVGRADRQPVVVDDPDLRVHVHGPAGRPGLKERAGEETAFVAALLGSLGEHAQLPARVVCAVVRLRRQKHDDPEVVGGRLAQLRGEDLDDLG